MAEPIRMLISMKENESAGRDKRRTVIKSG